MANAPFPVRTKDEARPAGEHFTETKGKAQDAGPSVADKAKDLASAVGHAVGDAASTAGQKAKDVASSVAQTAGDVASAVGHKAQDATSAVGSGMKSLAGTIRDKGPHEGMMATASSALAEKLDSGGRYLQEEGLKGMGEDFTNLIRRNPIPAVLIGIGLGYLIARSTRS